MCAVPELVEVVRRSGEAHSLAVNDDGRHLEPRYGLDNPRIPFGVVIALFRLQPHDAIDPPRDNTEPVVLDFVNPVRADRGLHGSRGEAGLIETQHLAQMPYGIRL